MTENDWLTSTDATAMLDFVRPDFTDRKVRLLDCAACRRIWRFVDDERARKIVDVSEQYANGCASDNDLAQVRDMLGEMIQQRRGQGLVNACMQAALLNCCLRPRADPTALNSLNSQLAVAVVPTLSKPSMTTSIDLQGLQAAEEAEECDLIRDVFGNPFRPVTFDPRWPTSDVAGVARGINDDRAFERMPILADALMDAGCEDDQVLGHCRSEGTHVRGCWVLDAVTRR